MFGIMIRSKIDIARNYPREDTQDPNQDMLVTPKEFTGKLQ